MRVEMRELNGILDQISALYHDAAVKYGLSDSEFTILYLLREEGVTHLRGGGKGDLYVTAVVEIPKKLTNQQKELLRQFDGTTSNSQYEKKKSFFDKLKDAFS